MVNMFIDLWLVPENVNQQRVAEMFLESTKSYWNLEFTVFCDSESID